MGMERTDGLAWLADASGAGGVPWPSALMLGAGLVLLGAVVWQWRRAKPRDSSVRQQASQAAEVESLVRELVTELDARADRLERLIAEADRRVLRLERPVVETKPERAPEPRADGDPMARRIYGLADEGLPVVEIARRLEQPTGKVELILALRGR